MVEDNNARIDFGELMARIREKIRNREVRDPLSPERTSAPSLESSAVPHWVTIEQLIAKAHQFWATGSEVPPMHRMTGLKRYVARPVAQAVLRVAQLITRDQRTFNQAVVGALRALGARLQHQEDWITTVVEGIESEVGRELATGGSLEQKISQLSDRLNQESVSREREVHELSLRLGALENRGEDRKPKEDSLQNASEKRSTRETPE